MRSFISFSAIERLMSARRSAQKERDRLDLISAQKGTAKELEPTFAVKSVEFNPQSRIAKIEILQSQQYRTISKYVTQNRVRYPIYSDWKVREKTMKKSIKLTNSVLETLDHHEDALIRQLSTEIVFRLNNEELFPSWFIINFLKKEWKDKTDKLINEKNDFNKENQKEIAIWKRSISKIESSIREQERSLKKPIAKKEKIDKKIIKIKEALPSPLLAIITFGIRAYLISDRRSRALLKKQSDLQYVISHTQSNINHAKEEIDSLHKKIQANEERIAEKENETQKSIRRLAVEYGKKIENVCPLPTFVENNNDFVPLKTVVGMDYEKIIGCYIIRNRENGKVYVGQSKDIHKRLHQHFRGTVPNNIIFAEDYYSSALTNKNDLFEVKIIPCSTKDELDRTERELIETYEAFSRGYNGTNGNL